MRVAMIFLVCRLDRPPSRRADGSAVQESLFHEEYFASLLLENSKTASSRSYNRRWALGGGGVGGYSVYLISEAIASLDDSFVNKFERCNMAICQLTWASRCSKMLFHFSTLGSISYAIEYPRFITHFPLNWFIRIPLTASSLLSYSSILQRSPVAMRSSQG